jgi:hypothetical protein
MPAAVSGRRYQHGAAVGATVWSAATTIAGVTYNWAQSHPKGNIVWGRDSQPTQATPSGDRSSGRQHRLGDNIWGDKTSGPITRLADNIVWGDNIVWPTSHLGATSSGATVSPRPTARGRFAGTVRRPGRGPADVPGDDFAVPAVIITSRRRQVRRPAAAPTEVAAGTASPESRASRLACRKGDRALVLLVMCRWSLSFSFDCAQQLAWADELPKRKLGQPEERYLL